ncbi:O-methyltransferase [Nakamurella sp. PAMC28650]|uniref:O-methyltransferase n=1 Tax=Nakamurella sp. PAMC28650 TaxID=2762325 RepID=UPI00164CF471|nr:class I SAM-dependent methyltransferase [Nakamurella sp. PAMC28650]QNK80354.1 class I SAM-dependent methyltransferase [Nakamurella sp. PAMC28650]
MTGSIAAARRNPATTSVPGSPRPVTPSSILAHRLEQLLQRVGEADGVEPSLMSELREICELAQGLDPYLDRWTTPESAALRLLTRRTQEQDWNRRPQGEGPGPLEQEMLSGHVEGQVLKMLVHATRAEHVLEIGMFTGYSALAMAEALPDGGRLVACEIDADVAAFAQRCFQESAVGHRITVQVGPALTTLHELAAAGQVFDLIFIDADKGGYAAYLDAILDSGLLAPHGLVCVDNTLMQGQPWVPGSSTPNGAAIAEFNQRVAADARVEQVIIPLRDGLTLIRRVDATGLSDR